MSQPIRKVPLTHGAQWLIRAINLGTRNPRAIFGAALLLIAVLYLVLYLFTMPLRLGADSISMDSFISTLVLAVLAAVLVLPVLLGGLMHVIREAENNRPVRARDLFAPLRLHKALPLALLGLIQIALALICGSLLLWATGPDFWSQYQDMARGAITGRITNVPSAEQPMLVILVQLAYYYFSTAVVLVSVPLIMFSGLGISDAVKRSLGASLWNLGSYLFAAMLFMFGAMITGLLVSVASLLLMQLGSLLAPTIGQLLVMALFAVYGTAFLVVMCGTCYFAWRDVFAQDEDAPTTPAAAANPGHFEA
ncbi:MULTISPECIES: hypothetical protein [Lysobacter]|jgi:MFS family permease|uniref:Transmembrane protein n=1 Tax=Lysobacter gummosus TaxID=262324 RepID=A0ABY3XCP9_9GAMM|nr:MULTISPECIES: hypothetical protein [Lysobacter]ALN94095.1 hypothetical protein LG3211_5162 [Lysobacter gummosus]UJB19370.1 hypothetical protein L1A79_24205 [Lysobacter capsici]UJQ26905.1 hypothetical protein L2D09_15680 [Lysobacter gummosus]UNP29520.1 hypothetical protein MOV92_24170 [Lysobacter gummosus]